MSSRTYRLLADTITALHFVWAFLIFGGAFFELLFPVYAIPQIVVLSITLLISLPFGRECPLTKLERILRRKFDPSYDNHGNFVTTYLNEILGTNFRTLTVNTAIGIFYTLSYIACTLSLIYR